MYLNKTILLGNLVRDPEVKSLPSGVRVANFSVATNRSFKDKDGNKQEQVEYHNVVSFGKQAELIAQYMFKGSQILVEGRLQTRSWDKDGVKMYRTEIMVENFQFGNKVNGCTQEKKEVDTIEYPNEEIDLSNIPF
jgi:single-strand DNA-binding protein